MFDWLRKLFSFPPEHDNGEGHVIVGAGQGQTNSAKLPDGRTATVSVDQRGKSASLDIE